MKDLIFRCSSLPNLMGARGLGKTGEKEAMKAYAAQYLDRHKEVKSKYLEKGIANEQEAIDMVNRVRGTNYKKNTDRYTNDYITGECDINTMFDVLDIKCSWDWFTFTDSIGDASYEWQLRGYMELYQTDRAEVVYCLTEMPYSLLEKQMEKEAYNWGGELPPLIAIRMIKNAVYTLDTFNNYMQFTPINFDSVQKEIAKFVPIPESERIHSINFERDEAKTISMYKRLDEAREFIKTHFKL